ncbi:MAG TPA: YebB family permuted papain-like enzyme [Aquabacterium sp.]|uniref:YebB family permuted papain-like enzyme n=1 Tax=Aquabacterium sp. TaxID=1872578 RepID=UPI002E35159B|nr:YebB family permuted papain-like enzyme [Aquabacterium sp.]HEX5354854.1 YebB family permuted papain-like enzyme [Aquabacterium sp.]
MPYFLPPPQPVAQLSQQVQVGDVVFIRVPARPFREVADATQSWTNHVGVVVAREGGDPVVAESTFPLSRFTTLSRFVARSEDHRVAVARLNAPLTNAQRAALYEAARQRTGVLYDTGFNLRSSRQFCSKYVREVVAQATGQQLGEVENFSMLLAHNPDVNLGFWRVWYFGRIPWQRETVSPASLLQSPRLQTVFDGMVTTGPATTG